MDVAFPCCKMVDEITSPNIVVFDDKVHCNFIRFANVVRYSPNHQIGRIYFHNVVLFLILTNDSDFCMRSTAHIVPYMLNSLLITLFSNPDSDR